MGLAVERLPLTLHWKKLYISGRSNDNDNLLGIDYGGSHIVALQRSSERRKTKQGEERHQPFPLLTMKENHRLTAVGMRKKPRLSRGNYCNLSQRWNVLRGVLGNLFPHPLVEILLVNANLFFEESKEIFYSRFCFKRSFQRIVTTSDKICGGSLIIHNVKATVVIGNIIIRMCLKPVLHSLIMLAIGETKLFIAFLVQNSHHAPSLRKQ